MNLISKILRKEKKEETRHDIPSKIDMHSHLLPALDDGVQSYEESIRLISELVDLGYEKLITTPHIMGDMFRNSKDNILIELEKLRLELDRRDIEITIEVAAEYYIDEWFIELIEKDDLLTFNDNYVLIETNFLSYHEQLFKEAIFKLKINGYKPIYAHPERYTYFWDDFDKYQEIKDFEIYFQINLVSLSGFYSPKVKSMAEKLIDSNMVEFVGTDTHSMDYIEAVKRALYFPSIEKLGSMELLNGKL